MGIVKLKESVDFESLRDFGFVEDPGNCDDPLDRYYYSNNYYLQMGDHFRITVNTIDRHIDILCYAKEIGLHNMFNVQPLFDLFVSGLVEVIEK